MDVSFIEVCFNTRRKGQEFQRRHLLNKNIILLDKRSDFAKIAHQELSVVDRYWAFRDRTLVKICALAEHVEKRCLARTAGAPNGDKLRRLSIARIIEQDLLIVLFASLSVVWGG